MIQLHRSLVVNGSNENTNIVNNRNIDVIDVVLVSLSLDKCRNLINVSFVDFEKVVCWKNKYPLILTNIRDLSFTKRKVFKGRSRRKSSSRIIKMCTLHIARIVYKAVRYTELCYENVNLFVLLKAGKKSPI